MTEGNQEKEIDVIKLKADYDTTLAELEQLKADFEDKTKEIARLQKYIADYVSSDEPAKDNDLGAKKSFNELYNDTIRELANKED